MNSGSSWSGSCWPIFEKCPECEGNQFILDDTTKTLYRCDYCHKGRIAVYYPYRHTLSKLFGMLCCCVHLEEPNDAKTRLVYRQLDSLSSSIRDMSDLS